MIRTTSRTSKATRATNFRGIREGYRSGLEVQVAQQLEAAGIQVKYEDPESRVEYRVEETHRYTPDFILPNGIIIETKGRFVTADRKKHKQIKEQHPELDIRFVFSNSKSRISKLSKTTYAMWCKKHGFKFADKFIPTEWIKERKKK